MTRRPVFIVDTQGISSERMKAQAQQAIRTYQTPPDEDESLPFLAVLDGVESRRFPSLSEAMTHVETVNGATGTVACLGLVVVRYQGGAVVLAEEFLTNFRAAEPTTDES